MASATNALMRSSSAFSSSGKTRTSAACLVADAARLVAVLSASESELCLHEAATSNPPARTRPDAASRT